MRPGRDVLVWAAVAAMLVACAPPHPAASGLSPGGSDARAMVDEAIEARGGPIRGVVRDSRVHVVLGFPGDWRWTTVAADDERYAWSIETNAEPQHHLFDGSVVRAFVGDRLVSEDASPAAALRSHARFVAVANLDVLRTPGVALDVAERGAASNATITAVFTDRGDRYEISITSDRLVRRVRGPIDLTPIARGELIAVYDDFAEVSGRRLPRRIRYQLDGRPLADEQLDRACVLSKPPPATSFATPRAFPRCANETPAGSTH